MTWERQIEEVRNRGGEMPCTELRGYCWQLSDNDIDPGAELTEKEIEDARSWLIAEIHKQLPDYADWYPELSSVILPIDKIDEFTDTVDWEKLKEKVWEKYCQA